MTTPRSRTGLAKLRGGTQPPGAETEEAPAPPVAQQREPEAAELPPVEDPAIVALTKPDKNAEPDTVDATEAPVAPTPAGVKQPISRRLLAALVALVVVVGVLLGFVIAKWDNLTGSGSGGGAASVAASDQSDTGPRLAALRSARQFAISFFTYDYRNMDAYFRRIEAASTGSFRSDFVSKEKTLKTVVTQLKTVANGQVPDAGAGIVAVSQGKAVALVAANFNASNAVTKNGQRRYRVKISLQEVKGQWLVSDFEQVA